MMDYTCELLFRVTPLLLSTVKHAHHKEVKTLLDQLGIGMAVLVIMDKYWTPEDRKAARDDFNARRTESPYYRLLYEGYSARVHFQQTDSHRAFIHKAYQELREFCPLVTEEQIQAHDMSKYSFEQAVGYTAKWVHGLEWNNPTWQAALQNHYSREPHHPEYHYGETDEMPGTFLQESLLDMVASRWERQLGGRQNVTRFELVDFDSKFLARYSVADRRKVDDIIREIQESK